MIKVNKICALIIGGLFLISCNSHKKYSKREEIKVLNDVFIELMGTENYYKPFPNPPYPYSLKLCENKEDSMKYTQWESEFNFLIKEPQVDSLDLVIAFSDTLISPFNYERENILNRIEYLQSYIPDSLDGTAILPLMSFLIDSAKYKLRDNVLAKVLNTGRYELREINQLRREYPRYKNMVGFRFIGDLKLSRIVFNGDRTCAVFYQEHICGGECGTGDIIWVKKHEGKWKIECRINLWVS